MERLPLSARDAQRSAQVGGTSALATQQHTCLVARRGRRLDALEAELGVKIYTSPLTQYNGALGAALMAYQVASRQK